MTEESNIVKKIQRNNTREKEIIQALEKKDELAWEEDGMAYMEGRIYVPNNKKLREEILKEHHNPADIRHPGQLSGTVHTGVEVCRMDLEMSRLVE